MRNLATEHDGETAAYRVLLPLCVVAVVLLIGCAAPEGTTSNTTGKSGDTKNLGETTSKTFKETTRRDKAVKSGTMTRETEGRMSVRETVGQMFVVGMSGTEPDYYIKKMIQERNVGGVLLFGYNMQSEGQMRALTESLQELSLATEPSIPLFVAVDQEGGEVASAPWVTPQPAAADLGSRADSKEVYHASARMGSELLRAGVNTDFAPVVDTGYGAAIGSRSFGDEPEIVSRLGAASVRGFRDVGVVSSAKHFPNHGVAETDSHTGLPTVGHDMETIESYDLPPFGAAVRAEVPMLMVGHLLYPAIDPDFPASLSPKAMGLLRENLAFDGIVVTDDLAMVGASGGGSPAHAAVAAVKAGADLMLISSPPQQQADTYEAVVQAVESGEIPRKQLEASFGRIEEVKNLYPLHGKLPLG